MNSTLGIGGSSRYISVQGQSYLVQQSIGQSSVIGTAITPGHVLRQGFIRPHGRIRNKIEASALQLIMYPNPVADVLTIQLQEDPDGPVSMVLSDMLGRNVLKQESEGTSTILLHLGAIPSGHYVLRLFTIRKEHSSKLIKE